jgi:hypothetical protein
VTDRDRPLHLALRPDTASCPSQLATLFPSTAGYSAALILQAFTEPATYGRVKGGESSVRLGLLYRQHAWAKLITFSASDPADPPPRPQIPMITGAAWQAILDDWLARTPGVTATRLEPSQNGEQRKQRMNTNCLRNEELPAA